MQDERKTREELLQELSHYRRQAERNLNEMRLSSLFKLSQMNHRSHNEVLDFGLEEAINLTESKIGYIYYYDEDTKNFTLYSWSASVMIQCAIIEKQSIYQLEKTGLWGEAVRQRKAIITNDYPAPNPYKKGYPDGHVQLIRHMNIPIFNNEKIVAVIGVGNKDTDYTESDVVQLQLFMDGLWNIAEKIRAEEEVLKSEQKFKAVADLSCDWEYWIAPNGDMIYCSPSCHLLTGYDQKEFLAKGSLTQSIVHPQDVNTYYDHVEYDEKQSAQQREITFRIVTKDSKEKWICHVCRPIYSEKGECLGRRVSNRDITDRKRDEALLLQSNAEIRRLNENILTMLRMMSHDIRSPLLTMSATLKLLQRGHYGHMDESATNTVKDLTIRVHRILGIADDCLGKAHAVKDSLAVQKQQIDLRQDIIEEIIEEFSSEIQKKNISIDNRLGSIPTGAVIVNASKIWLKSVYRNLFKNAIKYGGENITIAYGYEDHVTFYKLCVFNTGPVIPNEKRDILFTKFGRVGDGSVQEGVGMGLFLTKEVINQHGGEIWYEEIEHGGAFFFTLPK
ncbi:MAG: PAS domain S-box protein [Geobacteraceae bacterium]|nr:MAG: PAS domain S-box protein [Geobacteraceae bacterium]